MGGMVFIFVPRYKTDYCFYTIMVLFYIYLLLLERSRSHSLSLRPGQGTLNAPAIPPLHLNCLQKNPHVKEKYNTKS